MSRLILALVLCAQSALAWQPGGDSTASSWLTLVRAVRERSEATWKGAPGGTDSYFVPPVNYAQQVRLDLGISVTSAWDEILFIPELGPVVCTTNGAGIVTCWTNHVSLDTDYIRYGSSVRPFGPQWATNLLWLNVDSRLASFTNLPAAFTSVPSRAVVAQLDQTISDLIPHFVDVQAMIDVVPESVDVGDPDELINSYFTIPNGTNWYWVDSDTNGSGDTWSSLVVYPQTIPLLTMSNAWRHAGLEPFRYPSGVSTGSTEIFGWQTGSMGTYITGTNHFTITNWVEQYRFTRSPTVTPWAVTLGQLRIVETNRIDDVVTNVSAGATSTWARSTRHINMANSPVAFPVEYSDEDGLDGAFSPSIMGVFFTPTNYLHLVPPGTGLIWQTIYPSGWGVVIEGAAVSMGEMVWNPMNHATSVIESTAFTWHPTNAIASYAVTNIDLSSGSTALFFRAASLAVTNWPETTEVYSNGVLVGTNSIVGTTIDLSLRGVSIEYADPHEAWWTLGTNDYSERAAIVRQLKWTLNAEGDGHPLGVTNWWDGWNSRAGEIGSGGGDDRAANYMETNASCGVRDNVYSTSCTTGGIAYVYDTNNTCYGFSSFTWSWLDHSARSNTGLWTIEWRIGGSIETRHSSESFYQSDYWYPDYYGQTCWSTTDENREDRQVVFNPSLNWPESIRFYGSNLSPRLVARVYLIARVARVAENPYYYNEYAEPGCYEYFPGYPISINDSESFYVITNAACGYGGESITSNNTALISGDALGSNQISAILWAIAFKPSGSTSYAWAPIDFASGLRPGSNTFYESSFVFSNSIAWGPCTQSLYWGGTLVESGEIEDTYERTIYHPITTHRQLKAINYVIRWTFQNLQF